jgi:hypothetical protein
MPWPSGSIRIGAVLRCASHQLISMCTQSSGPSTSLAPGVQMTRSARAFSRSVLRKVSGRESLHETKAASGAATRASELSWLALRSRESARIAPAREDGSGPTRLNATLAHGRPTRARSRAAWRSRLRRAHHPLAPPARLAMKAIARKPWDRLRLMPRRSNTLPCSIHLGRPLRDSLVARLWRQ